MDQDSASRLSQEMANGIASLYRAGTHPIGQNRLNEFRSAAFYQAYEFIPDSATALVLTIDDAPHMVAVDGDRFYKLAFAPFDWTDNDIPAICNMQRIRPELAKLTVETLYHQAIAGVLTRTASWSFNLDGSSGISFQTQHTAEASQSDEERFARALMAAVDWEGPGEISPL
jgi:hypothetical protein